jgi:DNA-binding CsgD family transcriptional regulator
MNKHPLLAENEGRRLNLRLPWLVCFAMFAAWQMGMVYFSGQTMSVDGRTPLPVRVDDVTLIIAVGMVILYLLLQPYLMYIFRGRSVREIVEAHNAMAEETAPASEEAEKPAAEEAPPAESDMRRKLRLAAIEPLTPREYEIAEMTALGIKRQVIADTLEIRPSTVDFHRKGAYSKLGVSKREELLARLEELSRGLPGRGKEEYIP